MPRGTSLADMIELLEFSYIKIEMKVFCARISNRYSPEDRPAFIEEDASHDDTYFYLGQPQQTPYIRLIASKYPLKSAKIPDKAGV